MTLHINYATFKPVEKEDISNHKMYNESYLLRNNTYNKILKHKKNGQKIVSVGTTTTRVLETIARTKKLKGDTNIFIYPGFKFKFVDILITNFHLPYSTLLMLVYAFGSKELILKAYKQAIKEKYRFYSYGDCMIIL